MKPVEITEQEMPSLLKIEEFLKTISKKSSPESLGGFVYWIKKQGAPLKWPLAMWQAKLKEYQERKI